MTTGSISRTTWRSRRTARSMPAIRDLRRPRAARSGASRAAPTARARAKSMSSTRRLGVTNGIDLSPDGATLYVSESNSRQVWAYRLDGNKLLDPRLVTDVCGFRGRRPAHRRRWPDLSRAAVGRQDRHHRRRWIAAARGARERKAADQPHLRRSRRQNRLRDPEGRPLHRGVSRRPSRPRAMPARARHVLRKPIAERSPDSADVTVAGVLQIVLNTAFACGNMTAAVSPIPAE